MSYRIHSTDHMDQVVSKQAARPTASHSYSTTMAPSESREAADFDTLYNAVAVKRHLEAVGVHGLTIRRKD